MQGVKISAICIRTPPLESSPGNCTLRYGRRRFLPHWIGRPRYILVDKMVKSGSSVGVGYVWLRGLGMQPGRHDIRRGKLKLRRGDLRIRIISMATSVQGSMYGLTRTCSVL